MVAHNYELEYSGATASHSQPEYLLDIVEVSKSFRRHTLQRRGYSTFKSFLLDLLRGRAENRARYTEAIKNLTMRIPRGSSVGVIGRNGSGKSTLLKLISGIYKPDQGKISRRGRVAALIELGAGFHPDFSGRENLYLAGMLHGLSRNEITARFDQIVEFAELAEVIDDPVRTYSSGMFMRLGFSLAIHTDPDLLLVDEVLAVGDAAFVAKCKERISELRAQGKTLILVTHDLEAVERWCDEVLWLHSGEVRDRGDPRRVVDHYLQFLEKGEELKLLAEKEAQDELEFKDAASTLAQDQSRRWGSREVEIVAVRILDQQGHEKFVFHPDDGLRLEFEYVLHQPVQDVVFGVAFNRGDGLHLHGSNTEIERIKLPELKGPGKVSYEIRRLGLLEGAYSIDVAVHRADGYPFDYHKNALEFKVRSPLNQIGVFVPEHSWKISV